MEFKKPIYPIEQWNITETEFKKENNYRNETTFALSNGYIGTRGTFEEAYPFDVDTGLEGNFVNGFYESNEIRYGEANFGSPLLSQSLLNLPNLKEIHVILDGASFSLLEYNIVISGSPAFTVSKTLSRSFGSLICVVSILYFSTRSFLINMAGILPRSI